VATASLARVAGSRPPWVGDLSSNPPEARLHSGTRDDPDLRLVGLLVTAPDRWQLAVTITVYQRLRAFVADAPGAQPRLTTPQASRSPALPVASVFFRAAGLLAVYWSGAVPSGMLS